jgi:hypothetical protein
MPLEASYMQYANPEHPEKRDEFILEAVRAYLKTVPAHAPGKLSLPRFQVRVHHMTTKAGVVAHVEPYIFEG